MFGNIFSDEKRELKLEIIALDNRNESVRVKLGKQSHSEHICKKLDLMKMWEELVKGRSGAEIRDWVQSH